MSFIHSKFSYSNGEFKDEIFIKLNKEVDCDTSNE